MRYDSDQHIETAESCTSPANTETVTDNLQLSRRSVLKASGMTGAVGLSGLSGCTLIGGGGSSGDTITIGATLPLTGQFSSLAEDMEEGYRIGVQLLNENGGIDGQEAKLIISDDESDPEVVRQKLQQITSNNDVDMLWGSFSSLLVTAGSAYAEQNGIPFLGIAFSYMQPHMESNYEWTFIPFPKSRDHARSTVGILDTLPEDTRPSRVGIWEPNSGWGTEMADEWETRLSDAGYDIAQRDKFSLGSRDFSSLIYQADSAGVEVLLSNPTPPGAITAMNQMEQNGYAPKAIYFPRGPSPDAFWSSLSDTAESVLLGPGWVPGSTTNESDKMQNLYDENYERPDNGLLPVIVGSSFNLVQVADQALRNADSTDPSAIQESLRSTSFDTVVGSFSFDEYGMPADGELTSQLGQWWDGGRRLVYPETESENAMEFKYPLKPWDQR